MSKVKSTDTGVDPSFTKRFIQWSDSIKESEGVDLKDFPEHFGLSFKSGVLNNYRVGRNEPAMRVLRELKEKFPTLDLNWLICGENSAPTSDTVLEEILTTDNPKENRVHAKYMKLGDSFNAPITPDSYALYSETDRFTKDGMYVITSFNSGVMIVRNLQRLSENTYKVIAGQSSNRTSFEIAEKDIKFVGNVIAILQKKFD